MALDDRQVRALLGSNERLGFFPRPRLCRARHPGLPCFSP
jgi:hypothetical protein